MTTSETSPSIPHPSAIQLADRESWPSEISTRKGLGEVAMSHFIEPLDIPSLDDEHRAYDAMRNVLLSAAVSDDDRSQLYAHISNIERTHGGIRPKIVGNPFSEVNSHLLVPMVDTRPIIMADPKVKELLGQRDLTSAHDKLTESWPEFCDIFKSGIENGIRLGYIPEYVHGRIESALVSTAVRIADGAVLDTYGAITAYYRNESDEIGVRHDTDEIGEDLNNTLVHEFIHKVSGGTFQAPVGYATEFSRTRVGFSNEEEPEEISRVGLTEAMTQHVAMGVVTGDFETLDPN